MIGESKKMNDFYIDPPLHPSREGNNWYSFFLNYGHYGQTLITN